MTNWNGWDLKRARSVCRYNLGISLDGLKEFKKIFSQNNSCSDRDSNPASYELEAKGYRLMKFASFFEGTYTSIFGAVLMILNCYHITHNRIGNYTY
jgi:hypothetical protein